MVQLLKVWPRQQLGRHLRQLPQILTIRRMENPNLRQENDAIAEDDIAWIYLSKYTILIIKRDSYFFNSNGLCHPLNPFVQVPNSLSAFSTLNIVPSLSVSFTVQPRPLIPTAVGPTKHSPSVLHIAVVLSLILPPVYPRIAPVSVHHVIFPLAFVDPSVTPAKSTLTLEHLMHPFAFVVAAVLPLEFAKTVLFACHVVAFVAWTVGKLIYAFSVWKVLSPKTGVFWSVSFEESTLAMGLVSEESSFVDVFVGIVKYSLAAGVVFGPVSFVPITVRPFLHSISMLFSIFGLTLVHHISVEHHFRHFLLIIFVC